MVSVVRWWRSLSEPVRDLVGAVAFTAVSLVPALGPYGLVLGELPTRGADGWHAVLVVAQALPLALRRTAPTMCLAVVGVAFGLHECLAYPPSPAGLAVLFALYSVGAHQQRLRAVTAAAAVVAYVVLSVVLTRLGSPERPWEFATFAVVLAGAWGIGDLVRVRSAAARAASEQAARDAVVDERSRLARELHDVVTHHVTGMVVQAEATAFMVPDGDTQVRAQLGSIADAGRSALADLRQLLDVLGSDGPARAPAIGTVPELVAEVRRRGQRVELRETGSPTGGDELRLAVYRIVQEALTNARKHAPGAESRVALDWTPSDVGVRVATASAGTESAHPPTSTTARTGGGRGLAGLADRVSRIGGSLHAGVDDGGWFVVQAGIPVADGRDRDEHDPDLRR